MSHGKTRGGKHHPEQDFPALRDFFSGYLHQDFRDEYGSAAEAASAFRNDTTQDELAAVQVEWKAWRKTLEDLSATKRAAAIRTLGGAWQPESDADLNALERALGAT